MLPPHSRCALRERWLERLGDHRPPVSYDKVRQLAVSGDRKVPFALDGNVQEPSATASRPSWKWLEPGCAYRETWRRGQLEGLLQAIAAWDPCLGASPGFARFAAVVLPAVDHTKAAFGLLTGLNVRWRLSEYYSNGRPGLREDVQSVLYSVHMLWGDVILAFVRHQCKDLIVQLVATWLLSGLAAACNTNYQPFAEFLPLLNSLIMAQDKSNDPRYMLRHIVTCIIGRYHKTFQNASTRTMLIEICRDLSQHVQVDHSLLSLVDSNFSMEDCGWLPCAAYVPTGIAMGWLTGVHIASSVASPAAGALTASVAGIPGVCVAGAICGFAGACSAIAIGSAAGARFAQVAVRELLSIAETEQEQLANADGEACIEFPASKAAEFEAGFDFFLGGSDEGVTETRRDAAGTFSG